MLADLSIQLAAVIF